MTKFKVAVRVRPLSEREFQSGTVSVINIENEDTLAVTNIKVPEQNAGDSRERVRRFTFDYCFPENATQEMVFSSIENVIGPSLKQRFHSCVLAYGQSSTGKTHTMMGCHDDPGVIPMLCERVFSYLQETAVGEEMESLKVTVSYLEIYNEKVKDLLNVGINDHCKTGNSLKVREHPKKGPYVQGLSEHSVVDSVGILDCLERGNRRRRVAATLSNPQSSRSHSVFSVTCEGVKLTLIDLAGSERASNRCFNWSRFKEGANINKSLVALGNVISALADQTFKQATGTRRKFVPYRDSVLTWLLKDCLGINSNTFVIATVSPSSACYNETVNTLRFGQRAKLIVSRPVIHEDPKEKTIRELRREIVRLKDLLKGLQLPMNNIKNTDGDEIDTHQEVNKDLEDNSISNSLTTQDVSNNKYGCSSKSTNSTSETLLPLIDVSSSMKNNNVTQLRRTYSVDHGMFKSERGEATTMYSSNDSLPSTSTKSTPPSEKDCLSSSPKSRNSKSSTQILRRKSLTKNIISLPTIPNRITENLKKNEKSVSTENLPLKSVEAKVQSIRKYPVRPRSQIVAAVTSRLYSKLKKKEVATDTHDITLYEDETDKELKICSNARQKLREITRRALKSHRSKNEETQTEGVPIKILRERATDINDLLLTIEEVKEACTMSEVIQRKDAATECYLLNDMDTDEDIKITRSTQYLQEDVAASLGREENSAHPISFTKYLRDFKDLANIPIYANSLNINISHNFQDSKNMCGNESEVNIEENELNLPTPDLISNHNSLEYNSGKCFLKLSHGAIATTEDNFFPSDTVLALKDQTNMQETAHIVLSHQLNLEKPTLNFENTFAGQIYRENNFGEEHCLPMPKFQPQSQNCDRVDVNQEISESVIKNEPLILKSIVKKNVSRLDFSSSDEDIRFQADVMDSLEYHMANKEVKFSEKLTREKRIMKAMSGFIEEASKCMSKIDRYTSNLLEGNYQVEVTVNDVKTLRRGPAHIKKKPIRYKHSMISSSSETRDSGNQTYSPLTSESSTQYEDNYLIPINKYDSLLQSSCKTLHTKIQKLESEPARDNRFQEMLAHEENNSDLDYSSFESNAVAFSDYGSLPRRRHKRYRRPACSPSTFLKQLTDMRRQIVRSSREDLMSSRCNH